MSAQYVQRTGFCVASQVAAGQPRADGDAR